MALRTIILLVLSNIFMTFAWYGHLRHKGVPLWKVVLISWLIAFFEYCLQVPANRWGHQVFSAAQLKILQEAITLLIFAIFSIWYLKEPIGWNYFAAFVCIMMAVFFIFRN